MCWYQFLEYIRINIRMAWIWLKWLIIKIICILIKTIFKNESKQINQYKVLKWGRVFLWDKSK